MATISKINSVSFKSNKNTIKVNKNNTKVESDLNFNGAGTNPLANYMSTNNFIASQKINKSRNIAFKGYPIEDIPSNWELEGNRAAADSLMATAHTNKSLIDYMKANKGTIIPFLQYTGFGNYGPESHFNGFIVIGKDGTYVHRTKIEQVDLRNINIDTTNLTQYTDKYEANPADLLDRVDELGELENKIDNMLIDYKEKKEKNSWSCYEYRGTDLDQALHEKLIKEGKIDRLVNILKEKMPESGIVELIKSGRIDEALALGNNDSIISGLIQVGKVDDAIKLFGENQQIKEELLRTKRRSTSEDIVDIEKKYNIEEYAKQQIEYANEKAAGKIDHWFGDTPWQRAFLDISLCGTPEIFNQITKKLDKNDRLKQANGDIAEKRQRMINEVELCNNKKENTINEMQGRVEKFTKLEAKKENVKDEIQRKFIDLIELDQKKKFVKEFPNCLMLTGEHTPLMQNIIDWTGENTDCNYVKVPYIINNDDHQEAIGEALENAEKNYEQTGKRSLIYVNGLEKLINPKLNEDENIDCMKNLMNKASTNFHSTLIFTAKDPSKLDNIAIAEHRVTEIKVPITFDETRI